MLGGQENTTPGEDVGIWPRSHTCTCIHMYMYMHTHVHVHMCIIIITALISNCKEDEGGREVRVGGKENGRKEGEEEDRREGWKKNRAGKGGHTCLLVMSWQYFLPV